MNLRLLEANVKRLLAFQTLCPTPVESDSPDTVIAGIILRKCCSSVHRGQR